MKKLVLIIMGILSFNVDNFAQGIQIFDIDKSNYPEIEAKFIATDHNYKKIDDIKKDDIILSENGEILEILNVSCPANPTSESVSCVAVLDASGSMSNGNIFLAKEATKALIDIMPLGKSELAISAFNDINFFVQDFSTNANLLKNKLNNLNSSGGTDFDVAFTSPMAGGLIATQKAKHKKILIFLSDGNPNNEPDISRIINEANQQKVSIYTVTLSESSSSALQNIAEKTGGKWYDRVSTVEQAKTIFINIFRMAQNLEPCNISWMSKSCQLGKLVQLQLPEYSFTGYGRYTMDNNLIRDIQIVPSEVIRFGEVLPGEKSTRELKVSVSDAPLKINDIVSDNDEFRISDFGNFKPPFTLNPGDIWNFTVEFSPVDSSKKIAEIRFIGDDCIGNGIFLFRWF
jgi:uncharacterized protein YegL